MDRGEATKPRPSSATYSNSIIFVQLFIYGTYIALVAEFLITSTPSHILNSFHRRYVHPAVKKDDWNTEWRIGLLSIVINDFPSNTYIILSGVLVHSRADVRAGDDTYWSVILTNKSAVLLLMEYSRSNALPLYGCIHPRRRSSIEGSGVV